MWMLGSFDPRRRRSSSSCCCWYLVSSALCERSLLTSGNVIVGGGGVVVFVFVVVVVVVVVVAADVVGSGGRGIGRSIGRGQCSTGGGIKGRFNRQQQQQDHSKNLEQPFINSELG